MTDAEKIEWLTATNNALMESQERLAGEVKQLREDLDAVDSDDRIARRRFEAEVTRLQEKNKHLRKILEQVSTIPDAVQFWRSRAELERVEAFIKLIEMLPKEY